MLIDEIWDENIYLGSGSWSGTAELVTVISAVEGPVAPGLLLLLKIQLMAFWEPGGVGVSLPKTNFV